MKIVKARWDSARPGSPEVSDRQGIATTDDGSEIVFCGNIFPCVCGLPKIRRLSPRAEAHRKLGRDGFEYLAVLCGISQAWTEDYQGAGPSPGQPVIEIENDGSQITWM
jgi:hypothetical protein